MAANRRPLTHPAVLALITLFTLLHIFSKPVRVSGGTVDPESGLLPYHGANGLTIANSGLLFYVYERCPSNSFVANWTIGLSTVQGSSRTLSATNITAVTGLEGACYSISQPSIFVRRLWGYGSGLLTVRNVSVSFGLGNAVSGTEFNGTDYFPGGLGSFLGVGTTSFPRALAWQDTCPAGSAVDGYLLGLFNPAPTSTAASIVSLQLSCSGVALPATKRSGLEGPRRWYPALTPFLPIVSLDGGAQAAGVNQTVNGSQETWLPWHGKGAAELLSASQLLPTGNLLFLETQMCPPGAFVSDLLISVNANSSVSTITSLQMNCSNASTGSFVTNLQRLGFFNVTSASYGTVRLTPANATTVNGTTSEVYTGSQPSRLFTIGGATKVNHSWADTCPAGQLLDGFQGVADGSDSFLHSIRFHCSAPNVTAPANVSNGAPGGSPVPVSSPPNPSPVVVPNGSYPSPADAQVHILNEINALRIQNGVSVNLTSMPIEQCAAQALSQARGNLVPPNCSVPSPTENYNRYFRCLGAQSTYPAVFAQLIYCRGPALPADIVASWNRPQNLPYSNLLNASFVNAGVSQVGTFTTAVFTTAYVYPPPAPGF